MARILIVDDRAEGRGFLKVLLASDGHQVDDAADAEAALGLCRGRMPDLMITDVLMPGVDGYELIRRLRREPGGDQVKVLFWTAHYFSEDAQALAKAYGVLAVLPKPCEARTLLNLVRAALREPGEAASAPGPEASERHRELVSETLARTVGSLEGSLDRLAQETAQRLATEALLSQRDNQLAQAQRLEAAGRVAAGVAHDFNNYLAVILAAASLCADDLPRNSALNERVGEIIRSAEKAAALCRQLMVMGRRHPVRPIRLDLNFVVVAMRPVLQGLLKEGRRLELSLGNSAAWVKVDRAQLEQVLLNLVVNARDVIAPDGWIRVTVGLERLPDEALTAHPGLASPRCVCLEVADNGPGIGTRDLPHIFEPYYTTKPEGKGTGLGLALVYGIVQQAGGHVAVESRSGDGARFTVRFPEAHEPDLAQGSDARAQGGPPLGTVVRVLVVEDHPELLALVSELLRREGYEVLEAGDGEEALALARDFAGRIDLMLTDVELPGPRGPVLVGMVKSERPGLGVVLMSGQADREADEEAAMAPYPYLPKPFSKAQLLLALARALDAARAGYRGRTS